MPTAICPVCHREYEFSNARTDRCPCCVPKDEPDDCRDESDFTFGEPDQSEEAGAGQAI